MNTDRMPEIFGGSILKHPITGLFSRGESTAWPAFLQTGSVITSYSIHYTKLYDLFKVLCELFALVPDELVFGLENLGMTIPEIRERLEWVTHLTGLEKIV